MLFKDVLLKYKLYGIFLIMSLLLIIIGGVAQYINQKNAYNMQEMYTQRILSTQLLHSCHSHIKEVEVITQILILAPANQATRNTLLVRSEEHYKQINLLLDRYAEIQSDDISIRWLSELENRLAVLRAGQQTAIAMAFSDQNAYEFYQKNVVIQMDNIDALMQIMLNRSHDLAERQNAAGQQLSVISLVIIIIFSAVSVIIALALARQINKRIVHPLVEISDKVETVARGDMRGLVNYVPLDSKDEVGKLSQGFYRMAFSLTEYLRELEEKNRQIHRLAYLDPLTNLPNRRQLLVHLEEQIALGREKAKSFAVMFIDLDRFKNINDALGHDVGDELLIAVGQRLNGILPAGDILARLGGDEFTVILNDFDSQSQLQERVTPIVDCFLSPFEVRDNSFHLTASFGVSLFPKDGQDIESLLRAADTAMFSAKRSGRNLAEFYTVDSYHALMKRMNMERHLRKAIADNEFELYYQPILDIATGEITGMEALIRWQHAELGPIAPLEFIPIAEETELIVPLGLWVLRTACQKNRDLQNQGLKPLRVAVNLSPRQFYRQDLADNIKKILHETRMPAEYLELEITEGTLMVDTMETLNILHKLKDLNIKISIDDFGTGYSSLEYLKQFPIDCLKIDKTFISTIGVESDKANIARAIIGLANNLNLRVIAEGVETSEQLAFLKNYQCHEVQGYLFYRPLPADKLEKVLQDGKPSAG